MNLDAVTAAQLLERLHQLEQLTKEEPEPGTLFTDVFAKMHAIQQEVTLIYIELARRQAMQSTWRSKRHPDCTDVLCDEAEKHTHA